VKTPADNDIDDYLEKELGIRPPCDDPTTNWGTIILDAICVPGDIPCPVDLRLLNEARETTEAVSDMRFKQLDGKIDHKPRCNRDKARNRFLGFIKKKRSKNSLDTIPTRLVSTSKSVIGMAFFVMNAEKVIRLLRLFIY
jgi:hypothetical protein